MTTKKQIQEFIDRWDGHGDEKQETQKFWLDLMQNVLGMPNAIHDTEFEHKTAGGGFIDVLCPDARFLVEQKSADIDLDKKEPRQGEMVTPVEQALRYAGALPFSLKPSVICTCNFQRFRFYDLEKDPLAKGKPAADFTLQELGDHIDTLASVFDANNSRLVVEQQLSEKAGILVARLHNAIAAQYADPDDPGSHHSLAVLTVRFVFALYAEDAGLFPQSAFSRYVESFDAAHLRRGVIDLFRTLNTKEEDRDKYLEPELAQFPYVNGGLFAEDIEIPQFTDQIRESLLTAGDGFDWRKISPVIFGSLMEETLSHDQRRKGGMHYTTVKNIHKVVEPLFLNSLKTELDRIEKDKIRETTRVKHLKAFQDKLASLQFLDPACGSGNFLTETFLRLRELENRAISDMLHGQGYMELGGENSLVKVRIDQFHGIEINDFAVSVAKTALWIAEQQALDDTEEIAGQALPHLPLHDSGNIIQANALQYDWNELLPADQCSYVMGNPPFVGHQYRTAEQQYDMDEIFSGYKSYGKLDYVAAWFAKAVQYIGDRNIHVAFVSTNSICQGESVGILWRQLRQQDIVIEFAHTTFVWDAQSTDEAHVHVVIVGFCSRQYAPSIRKIYAEEGIKSVPNINGYLHEAPDVFIQNRSKSVNPGAPEMTKGSQPTDGGNLILSDQEKEDLLRKHPLLSQVIRPYVGGREFLNGGMRWCLWFVGAQLSDYMFPEIRERLNAIAALRSRSATASVRRDAATPALFTQIRQPQTAYIAVPEVSSGRREYLPIGYMDPNIIASNKLRFIPSDDLTIFGLLSSRVHMAWIRVVAGRLKSDFSYSPAVYDSFVFPAEGRDLISTAAQSVLDARKLYPGKSLADMYKPENKFFFPELMQAHRKLDEEVLKAYGLKIDANDAEIVNELFADYVAMAAVKQSA